MNKRTECIKRLFIKQHSYNSMCEWLMQLKLTNELEVNTFTRDQERAEFVLAVLDKAVKDEKFQMVDFEWTILPLETIKITCVTEWEEKVFSYGH